MYSHNQSLFPLRFPRVLVWLGVFLVLAYIGLGWLIKSLLILIALLLVAPFLALVAVRWWLQRHLIQGECPVCHTSLTAVGPQDLVCPACREPLQVQSGKFVRLAPTNTIDVQAVEVQPPNHF